MDSSVGPGARHGLSTTTERHALHGGGAGGQETPTAAPRALGGTEGTEEGASAGRAPCEPTSQAELAVCLRFRS